MKKNKITKLAGLIALALVMSIFTYPVAVAAEAPSTTASMFTDVPETADYREAVEAMAELGVVNGMGDGTFQPLHVMTKAQVCQVIAKAYHAEVGPLNDGSDSANYWAGKAIQFAYDKGFITGSFPITAENYDKKMTRAEAIDAILKALYPLGIEWKNDSYDVFDLDAIPSEYKTSVLDALRTGLLDGVAYPCRNGLNNGVRIYPQAYISRADVCQILYNSGVDFTDLSVRSNEVSVTSYKVSGNGFALADANVTTKVNTISNADMTYYSMTDIESILGMESKVEDGFSKYVFNGSYQSPKYTVPVKSVTMNGEAYEFRGRTVSKDSGDGCLYLNDLNNGKYPFIENEKGLYVAGPILHYMTGRVFAAEDGSLRILSVIDGNKYPRFIQNSTQLTAKEKDTLRSALWLLYNTYTEGYDIVKDQAKKIVPDTETSLKWRTGETDRNVKACAEYSTRYIYWVKDGIADDCIEDVAATLVHEATHLQQFNKGDYSENMTVLNQGKTLYYAGEADYTYGNPGKLTHYPEKDKYGAGSKLLADWLSKQAK